MAYSTLTLEEAQELVRNHIRNMIPGADVSRGSDYDISARIMGAVFFGNQAQGIYLTKQILPSTSEAEFLALHAVIRGLPRRGETKAVGTIFVEATVGGASQSVGSEVVHADGTKYTLDGTAVAVDPSWTGKTVGVGSTAQRILVLPDTSSMSAGHVISIGGVKRVIKEVLSAVRAVDLYNPLPSTPTAGAAISDVIGCTVAVTCSEAGTKGNKDALETLTLSSPGANIVAATTVLEMAGGAAVELDAALRARVMSFVALRPGSGNLEDYHAWALETPDVRVGQAWIYPALRGLGTIDVVIAGPTLERFVGAAVEAKVVAYLATKAAFADDIFVDTIQFEGTQQVVSVTIEPSAGYEPDWTGAFGLGGGSHTTTRVYVTATPVGTIEVGDRVLVPIAEPVVNSPRLEQRKVTIVTSTYVEVDSPLSALPDGTMGSLRPGGPLAQPVIDAIVSYFDLLGPGVFNGSNPTVPHKRHPPVSDGFDGELRRARLTEAVMAVPGVADVTVGSPATDQKATARLVWAIDHVVVIHG